MRLVDANLLLYAVDQAAPYHLAAKRWLERSLSGSETFALSWVVLLAFLRLSTHARVFERPLPPEQALDLIDSWLAQPCVTVLHPTERHPAVMRTLLDRLGTAGNLVNDAHLAALAIEHGAELCSADNDFARFPGLRFVNPLMTGKRR